MDQPLNSIYLYIWSSHMYVYSRVHQLIINMEDCSQRRNLSSQRQVNNITLDLFNCISWQKKSDFFKNNNFRTTRGHSLTLQTGLYARWQTNNFFFKVRNCKEKKIYSNIIVLLIISKGQEWISNQQWL